MGSECSKDTFGSRSTPQYYHSSGYSLQHPPLAFLVITEALTRLIQNDPHINGIEIINGEHIKISQFADDTSLFAETYEEFLIALEWVEVYEKATGSKVNTHKYYVGIYNGGPKKAVPPPSPSVNSIGSNRANTQKSWESPFGPRERMTPFGRAFT
eukprot:scaffold1024_cov140-Isochrysis_galbana.AAC.5